MRYAEPCMCGALDCRACRGYPLCVENYMDEDAEQEAWEDTSAHYEATMSRSTVHVARKEHLGGQIQPGDTYRRTVTGGYISACAEYPEGGPRWLEVRKSLVKRAEVAA